MQASLFQHKPQQIDLVTGARIGRTSKSIWFLFPKFNEPRTPESHVFPWNKKVAYLKLFGVLFPFSGPLGSIPICQQLWTAQVLITAWANEPAKWKPMWEEPVWYQFWTISAIPIKCFFVRHGETLIQVFGPKNMNLGMASPPRELGLLIIGATRSAGARAWDRMMLQPRWCLEFKTWNN